MNSKRLTLSALIVLFFSLSTIIGQTTVKGKIVDALTGEPLIGANILESGQELNGTITDFDGDFELMISKFPAVLRASYIGYEDLEIEIANASQNLMVKLSESAELIDLGVEIKGQRVSEKQKAAPLTIESLDAIAIKQTASTDFYNGLGSLKGVDLTTASLGFTVINTRGFNSTSPVRSLQTIDGVDNQSPGLNFSLGNFLGASELDIQKVDLVVGASSAFYGPNAFNGVIAMETKNPFFHRGLSASVKVGERSLRETAFRFAKAFNNKEGKAVVAYKLNFSYLGANDWEADNYNPVDDSDTNRVFLPLGNPGGFNAVNIYGDEYFGNYTVGYDQRAGLNSFYRTGYREIDLVDYKTNNVKAGAAVHFRLKPSIDFESPELVVASNFGYGTTVYQGDNRFSLRGIKFFQHKLELKKRDKYFLRAYVTHEDAGRSYDPYLTAQKMLETAASNENWKNAYEEWWTRNSLGHVFKEMQSLGYTGESTAEQIKWQQEHRDELIEWHRQASEYANSANKAKRTLDFFEPGTERFDSLFNSIVSRKNNFEEDGSLFFDKSMLIHMHGEYKFDVDFFKELTVGANARMYRPNSEGTIFSDSIGRITNREFGFYGGASKQLGNFTLSAASRVDKNENFKFLVSPAASVVWNPSENNYLRASFSSAIRNPTLTDQYLDLKVGPARLLGNINGFENLVTYQSFKDFTKSVSPVPLISIDIPAIQPEKVQTFEVGYRTTLFDRVFVDASAYYNRYRDFIGYQIGLDIPVDTVFTPGLPPIAIRNFSNTKVYRIAANSQEIVTSRGVAVGVNYYFNRYYSFNGNYSYNELVTKVDDDIVPAFNTPKNKYNIGISGRDIPVGHGLNTLGFNLNYKWIQSFVFEGSPQFTGTIPTYDLVDAQVNYTLTKQNLVFKLGASNLLNNKKFQTYGGPAIGRMGYLSITYDFREKI